MAAQLGGNDEVRIGFVCNHGKHRSVAMAELAAYCFHVGGWETEVVHCSEACLQSNCSCHVPEYRRWGYCREVWKRSNWDVDSAWREAEAGREAGAIAEESFCKALAERCPIHGIPYA